MPEELAHVADRQDRKSRGTAITGFKHNVPDLGEPGRRLAISLCWQLPNTPSDAVSGWSTPRGHARRARTLVLLVYHPWVAGSLLHPRTERWSSLNEGIKVITTFKAAVVFSTDGGKRIPVPPWVLLLLPTLPISCGQLLSPAWAPCSKVLNFKSGCSP